MLVMSSFVPKGANKLMYFGAADDKCIPFSVG